MGRHPALTARPARTERPNPGEATFVTFRYRPVPVPEALTGGIAGGHQINSVKNSCDLPTRWSKLARTPLS